MFIRRLAATWDPWDGSGTGTGSGSGAEGRPPAAGWSETMLLHDSALNTNSKSQLNWALQLNKADVERLIR